MPFVLVCALRGNLDLHHTIVNTYILDFARDSIDVLCNSEHPEDGRLYIAAFRWFQFPNI